MLINRRVKNPNGRELIIKNFCIAVRTLESGFTCPRTMIASQKIKIRMAQAKRYLLEGSCFPLSVNILKTKIAESTEVTRKLINNIITIILVKLVSGKDSKKINMEVKTFPNLLLLFECAFTISNAEVPKILNQKKLPMEGITRTPRIISLRLLPLEILAMKIPVKGAHASQKAQ